VHASQSYRTAKHWFLILRYWAPTMYLIGVWAKDGFRQAAELR
jgi:hypothetical protein